MQQAITSGVARLLESIPFRLGWDLVMLGAGCVLLVPLALSRRCRKWLARFSADDITAIGLVGVALAWTCIVIYNRFIAAPVV